MDAPNVMNLIKDTKAAQEVPSKPISFTFLFGTTEKIPYYVYLFYIECGLSFYFFVFFQVRVMKDFFNMLSNVRFYFEMHLLTLPIFMIRMPFLIF